MTSVRTCLSKPGARGAAEEGGVMNVSAVHEADKRAAMEQVLRSTTFVRANQVRNFLRYICEMEFAGRGAALHEYLIGVEAMGRPMAYSPEDDSSVRRRAFALRRKLEQVYARELVDAAVRIDVPKGSYVPRFVHVQQSAPDAA
jgi:hypothetical protein